MSEEITDNRKSKVHMTAEKLKIFSLNGDMLVERDLAGREKPLMILAGDEPRLVDAVPPGEEVLGALVRDEDGWTLASAKSDVLVSSGPKEGADFHLTAGVACSLGEWVFRIEREGADAGTILLWRVGSSAIAADPLVAGRNLVSASGNGTYSVNPAVPGIEICQIFPTAEGVDVTVSGDETYHLSAPFSSVFAVGRFRGMALPAADAAAAVKSGNPFGWPARGTRKGLMAMAVLVGLVALVALSFSKQKGAVEAALAAKHGPEEHVRTFAGGHSEFTDEEVLVYKQSFYSSLPLILQAERSPITRDLIQRGMQLSGHIVGTDAAMHEKSIKAILGFLKSVDAIQDAVLKGEWAVLKDTLAAADRTTFTQCDADAFYDDAREVAEFVTETLPQCLAAASKSGADGLADADRRIRASFDDMVDNIFMAGDSDVVRRERDNAQERWNALAAYVPVREKFLSAQEDPGDALRDAWADFADAFDQDDPAFAPMVKREREALAAEVLRRAETAKSVALIRLCAIGDAVGIDEAVLAGWKKRAADARKEVSRQYREKYSDYRMRAAVAPGAPETLAVLDEMTALGMTENPFHQWALREKARVQSKGSKEEAK